MLKFIILLLRPKIFRILFNANISINILPLVIFQLNMSMLKKIRTSMLTRQCKDTALNILPLVILQLKRRIEKKTKTSILTRQC